MHHDILLPAFPLCSAWLDCSPGGPSSVHANMVAVGTMEPGIEIWDIDVVDAVEPAATLGGEEKTATGQEAPEDKKKKNKKVIGRLGGGGDLLISRSYPHPEPFYSRRKTSPEDPRSRREATRIRFWACLGTSSTGTCSRLPRPIKASKCGTSRNRPASTLSSTTRARCRLWLGTLQRRRCSSPERLIDRPAL